MDKDQADIITIDQGDQAAIDDVKDENREQEQLIFLSEYYSIILLMDGTQPDNRTIRDQLNRSGVNYEICNNLPLGNFVWIARKKDAVTKEGGLVLPYMVVRKKWQKFGSDIKDGTLHRLKIELERLKLEVTLIIEKDSPLQHLFTSASGIPARNILTAMRNCEEKNKFSVKKTDTLQATVHHVSVLTREIIERFKEKDCVSCLRINLPKFNQNADLVSCMTLNELIQYRNTLTAQELWLQQLLLLKRVTFEKALAIVQKYPTCRSMIDSANASTTPQFILSNITYGIQNRKIGNALSEVITDFFRTKKV